MTDATERRCGTCRYWWEQFHGNAEILAFGRCHYPLPISLRGVVQHTSDDDGRDCPTWEARND